MLDKLVITDRERRLAPEECRTDSRREREPGRTRVEYRPQPQRRALDPLDVEPDHPHAEVYRVEVSSDRVIREKHDDPDHVELICVSRAGGDL